LHAFLLVIIPFDFISRESKKGRSLGFTAFTSGWIGPVGWCHCLFISCDRLALEFGRADAEIMDIHILVLFCIVIIVVGLWLRRFDGELYILWRCGD
jgi:hypothetical protein